MKSVYIIRHAKSSWEEPDLPDVVRPLNKRGLDAAATIGKYLARLHAKPDLIISSPATRAYHTAVVVAQTLGYRLKQISVQPAVYFEGEQGVLNLLREQEDVYDEIFIFGHEPTCSDIVHTLCHDIIPKFSTAGMCKINLDIDSWKDIYSARGKKEFFVAPKMIKE